MQAYARPFFQFCYYLLTVIVLSACHGQDEEAPPAVANNNFSAPQLTQTVALGGSVTGLTAGSRLTLKNQGIENMTLTANGEFRFTTPLARDTAYNVTITSQPTELVCDLANGTGTLGSSDNTALLITCRRWEVAQPLGADDAGNAHSPQLAVNNAGEAIVVGYQQEGGRYRIIAHRYTPQGGWENTTPIETLSEGYPAQLQVALNAQGSAIAVWRRQVGVHSDLWAAYYSVGRGWGSATRLTQGENGRDYSPTVAMDGSGNALLLWSQSDGQQFQLWANRYVANSGWDSPTLVTPHAMPRAQLSSVVLNERGEGLALWAQVDADTGQTTLWANHFTMSSGWESPTAIVSRDIGSYPGYHLAIDNLGRAMAIWTQIYNSQHDTQIATSRYLPGEGWTTPTVITPTKLAFLSTTSPFIAVDNAGNAMAVWIQYHYPTGYVWANRFDSEQGWGEAQRIDSQQLWDATYPKVALDDQGNAVAVWSQDDNRFTQNIHANHYLANAGWGHDRLLEENNTGDAERRPQVGIDGAGQATVVWGQRDSARNTIWTNRYH